jgi:hypothetical protein
MWQIECRGDVCRNFYGAVIGRHHTGDVTPARSGKNSLHGGIRLMQINMNALEELRVSWQRGAVCDKPHVQAHVPGRVEIRRDAVTGLWCDQEYGGHGGLGLADKPIVNQAYNAELGAAQ